MKRYFYGLVGLIGGVLGGFALYFPGGSREPIAIALWLFTIELLAIIALPITIVIFRRLPDRGYIVSKVVGMLIPCYFVWLLAHFNLLSYSREAIVLVVILLFIAACFVFLKYQAFFSNVFQTQWHILLIHESVFLLAFASFILFRMYNPDIFWSESSMDFSFVNVLTRTETLPPQDPWLSGYPLNYYYFGHYLVASLTKLTGIPSEMTYNLAFALFPALVAAEVFSLLYNLTKRYLDGVIGVLFSSVIGNLDGFFLLVDLWRKKEPYYRFFRPAHEVIPYTVHEFPIWTFIFVDLHAHLLNMPFLLATFIIGLNLLFRDFSADSIFRADDRFYLRSTIPEKFSPVFIEIPLYALIIGTLGVINSWDYPTGGIFLIIIALVMTYKNHYHRGQRWLSAFYPLGLVVGIILPASILFYLPFYTSFSRSRMGIAMIGASTTQLSNFLTIFGVFFFVLLSFFIIQTSRIYHNKPICSIMGYFLLLTIFVHIIAEQLFQLNIATFLFIASVVVFGSCLFVNDWKADFDGQTYPVQHLYIWLCLMYACLITAGCEIIFVRDFLQGGEYQQKIPFLNFSIPLYDGDYKRMNTIFKFYIPAWFLFSFAAAYSFAQIRTFFKTARRRKQSFWKTLWFLCFGLLFLFSLTFPVMGIYARRHQQDVYHRAYLPSTLDGLAYIRATNPDEYYALQWLNQHVRGTPVILEATGPDYLYEYARISANTGLPTILGWKSHAEQREHWSRGHQRLQDVNEIYTSLDIKRVMQLLRHYRVQYIYIGYTERRDFSIEDLQKFQQYPGYFKAVFQSGDTVIYQVWY